MILIEGSVTMVPCLIQYGVVLTSYDRNHIIYVMFLQVSTLTSNFS